MKILVLGNGFIGSNLVSRLLNFSDYKITVLNRAGNIRGLHEGVNYVTGDYTDKSLLQNILQHQDVVYHLLSETLPFSSWSSPKTEVEKNLIPFLDLLDLLAFNQPVKLVFVSSGGTVYGNSETHRSESDVPAPFVPYGIIKLTMEYFLNYARQKSGLTSYIFRISNVFGPGQMTTKGLGFVNTLLEAAIHQKPITVFGDGENTRDYVYVQDCCSLLLPDTLQKLLPDEVYNLASGNPVSQNQLIAMVTELTGLKLTIEYQSIRKSDIRKILLDNSKLTSHLPGFRFTSLMEALTSTYQSLRSGPNPMKW